MMMTTRSSIRVKPLSSRVTRFFSVSIIGKAPSEQGARCDAIGSTDHRQLVIPG
jgi:hypothetical protein